MLIYKNEVRYEHTTGASLNWTYSGETFTPIRLVYPSQLDKSVSNFWGVLFISLFFTDISLLKANSADPDKTPHSAASDLGVHCLPRSHH